MSWALSRPAEKANCGVRSAGAPSCSSPGWSTTTPRARQLPAWPLGPATVPGSAMGKEEESQWATEWQPSVVYLPLRESCVDTKQLNVVVGKTAQQDDGQECGCGWVEG